MYLATSLGWLLGFQEVKAPGSSRHSAHEGGKVAILTHRPSLPPGSSWYSFLEAEQMLILLIDNHKNEDNKKLEDL
jgi:hypothetical protein